MPILSTTLNKRKNNIVQSAAGFTLIEILVALILIVVVLASLNLSFNPEDKLDNALDSIERSVRYSTSEAILRNTMVRLHFDLTSNPSNFTAEYNESKKFLLQQESDSNSSVKSLAEEDEENKEKKKVDDEFQKLPETEEVEFDDNIQIIAFASAYMNAPVKEDEPSLYIYPSGEKDESMILVQYKQEVAALFVSAFSDEMIRKFYKIEEGTEEEINANKDKLIREIYDQWKKGQIEP